MSSVGLTRGGRKRETNDLWQQPVVKNERSLDATRQAHVCSQSDHSLEEDEDPEDLLDSTYEDLSDGHELPAVRHSRKGHNLDDPWRFSEVRVVERKSIDGAPLLLHLADLRRDVPQSPQASADKAESVRENLMITLTITVPSNVRPSDVTVTVGKEPMAPSDSGKGKLKETGRVREPRRPPSPPDPVAYKSPVTVSSPRDPSYCLGFMVRDLEVKTAKPVPQTTIAERMAMQECEITVTPYMVYRDMEHEEGSSVQASSRWSLRPAASRETKDVIEEMAEEEEKENQATLATQTEQRGVNRHRSVTSLQIQPESSEREEYQIAVINNPRLVLTKLGPIEEAPGPQARPPYPSTSSLRLPGSQANRDRLQHYSYRNPNRIEIIKMPSRPTLESDTLQHGSVDREVSQTRQFMRRWLDKTKKLSQ